MANKIEPSISLRTLTGLAAGVGVLSVSHFIVSEFFSTKSRAFQLLFMGYDTNIPAWYSSMLLVLPALLAFECYKISQPSSRSYAIVFVLLSVLFLFMSCDEIARFHETVPEIFANYVGLKNVNPFEGHPWVLWGGPTIILIFAVAIFFSRKTLTRFHLCMRFMIAGFGAIVFGGVFLEVAISLLGNECRGTCRFAEILIEETLEMGGTLLICTSLVIWRNSFCSQ